MFLTLTKIFSGILIRAILHPAPTDRWKMKILKKRLIICAVLSCILAGCGDVTQEMWLESDGSGQLHLGYDLSPMLPLFDLFSQQPDSTKSDQSGIVDVYLNELGISGSNIDTTLNITEIDFSRISPSEEIDFDLLPDFLKGLSIHIKTGENNESIFTSFILSFQNFSELDSLVNFLNFRIPDQDLIPFQLPIFNEEMKFSKKTFEVRDYEFRPDIADSVRTNLQSLNWGDMLEPGNLISIYHFPYKIKKTTAKNATIDENMLTLIHPLTSIKKGSKFPGFIVKFRRK